jgi:catechol 2,3-dioxygenase-like lactoylglutathione lyase family enzyme
VSLSQIRNFDYAILLCNKMKETRAFYRELVAQGVPILRGPTDLPDWRHRTLFFRDPEDNIFESYAEY